MFVYYLFFIFYNKVSIKTEEEKRAFERRALKEAFGKQCAITCGGRIEQEDKSDTSKFKKHSVSIFASANVGQVSSFGLDLISYNILAMSKNRSIPELGSGIRFRPHVRGWYKAQVGNFNPTEWSAFSWGGSFLTEFMAPIPSPGAHHYKTPKLSTNFLRNSLSAIVRVPLRRLFMGKVGPGLEVFGQCGLLTSLACKRPSEAMENLEEFENNGSVIRTMSLSMIPPNMKCSRPVTAFYSLNTTLGIPCPRFPRLTLAGFFDVGNVARSLRCLFAAGPRATAGLAIRFPIGAGDVELNFGVPLVERKGKDEASRYGISSAFKPF